MQDVLKPWVNESTLSSRARFVVVVAVVVVVALLTGRSVSCALGVQGPPFQSVRQ